MGSFPRRVDLGPSVPGGGAASTRARWVGTAAGALAGGLYAGTVIRGLGWDDAAELTAGIENLGVVHQTGYPAYLVLGKAFTSALPFLSTPTAVNLFSGVAAAGCVGTLAALTTARTRSAIAGIVAAALLATGSLFWTHARIASVYPLFVLVLMGLVAAVAAWEHRPTPRRLVAVGALAGTVIVSHKTGLAFAAAAALHVLIRHRPALRRSAPWAAVSVALAMPLASVGYIALRSGHGSFPDQAAAADASSWRWAAGTVGADDAAVLGADPGDIAQHVAELGLLGLSQLSLAALLLVPVGLWAIRRDHLLLECGVAPALVVSAVTVTTPGAYGYWHFPLLVFGALTVGAGAASLLDRRTGFGLWVFAGVLVVALASAPVKGVRYAMHEDLDATSWARATMEHLPPGASPEVGWTAYTVLLALQELEGIRPDLTFEFGPFLFTHEEFEPSADPLVIAVSTSPLRSTCEARVRGRGPQGHPNFKGLTDLSLRGVLIGTEPWVVQAVTVGAPDPGCHSG